MIFPGQRPSTPIATAFPAKGLLFLVALIQLATMPAFIQRGDAVAIRGVSAHLIHFHSLGIPAEAADYLGSFTTSRGQYYFENTEKQRLYSKYGLLNTLLFVPPCWIHLKLTGEANAYDFSHTMVFVLNGYFILLTLLIAHRLLRIAGLYTTRKRIAWLYVFATIYTTFLWYYSRAQGSEAFQVLFFLCFFDHFVRALRRRRDPTRALTIQLIASFLFLLGLVLIKAYYVLLLPAMAFAWIRPHAGKTRSVRVLDAARLLVPPGVAIVAVLLAVNTYKFGSPLEFGYSQYERDAFHPFPQWEAVWGFLLRPDRSLFLHAPILLLALIGWRRFAEDHRTETTLILAAFLPVFGLLCCFNNWPGHWSYGPRYLAVFVPLLAVPVIPWLDARRTARIAGARLPTWPGLAVFLAAAFWMQLQVIREPFFLYYDLKTYLADTHVPGVDDYFERRNFSLVYRDVRRWQDGQAEFPPLAALRPHMEPDRFQETAKAVAGYRAPNLFWLYPIDAPR